MLKWIGIPLNLYSISNLNDKDWHWALLAYVLIYVIDEFLILFITVTVSLLGHHSSSGLEFPFF